jgi:hypothetical protein
MPFWEVVAARVAAIVGCDMAVAQGGSGLERGGCGVCRGGMDRAGSMCCHFQGAGDCFEARDGVVVAIVDNVDGGIDVVLPFWSVTCFHPASSCLWWRFSVLWWWPSSCSSPCCSLFTIPSLSLLPVIVVMMQARHYIPKQQLLSFGPTFHPVSLF